VAAAPITGSPVLKPGSAPRQGALSDRLLASWLRCRRRAWLDRHGPAERRVWSAHRALALDEQRRLFQLLLSERPGHGESACREGRPGVMGLRLGGWSGAGQPLEAHPSLLWRLEGASQWGPFRYQPVLARQGHHVTREHRLVLALWGRLLAERQGAPVEKGLVLGGAAAGRPEKVNLAGSLGSQLDQSLSRLAADLERQGPPPLVSDRKKCTLCSWRDLCDGEARQQGHLSEVSGIGGKRRELLVEAGISSLAELAAADPQRLADALAAHGEQHREMAPQLVAQALVQQRGQAQRLHQGPALPEPALPELARAPGVLLYDIESDPDARDDFLHGLVILRRQGGAAQPAAGAPDPWPVSAEAAPFTPLLALREHGEARLWRRLAALLARYPDWPVLHYGETEAISLLRLAERQGLAPEARARLRSRLVDVHARLRRHWLLPVPSYGLKSVAGWLGFEWRQKGVDGARCLMWWRQWRQWHLQPTDQPGDPAAVQVSRQLLQRLFRYNQDDNLATWAVARWLLDQDQNQDTGQDRA